jgi:hypothetical protein
MAGSIRSIRHINGIHFLFETLEERIVLDGAIDQSIDSPDADDLLGSSKSYDYLDNAPINDAPIEPGPRDGQWHELKPGLWFQHRSDGYDYYWHDGQERIAYGIANGDWWETDGVSWWRIGDSGASEEFVYDDEWYLMEDGSWFYYHSQVQEPGYASEGICYWYNDEGEHLHFLMYIYGNGQWYVDDDGDYETYGFHAFGMDGAPTDFVYDGEWHALDDGRWYRYDILNEVGYFWFNGGIEISYLAYEYEVGQWWLDVDGDWQTPDWVTLGSADAQQPFLLGSGWTYSHDFTNHDGYWVHSNGEWFAYEYDEGQAWWYDDVIDDRWETYQTWHDDGSGTLIFNDWAKTYYDDGDPDFIRFQDHQTLEWGLRWGNHDYYAVHMTDPYYRAGDRNEAIFGTIGDDKIDASGLAYTYLIIGGMGDDTIYGGARSTIIGDSFYADGFGDDVIYGGGWATIIVGDSYYGAGHGDDIIHGGNQGRASSYGDSYYGDGHGNDIIYAGNAGWNCVCGDSYEGNGYGDDIIHGSDVGWNSLYGDSLKGDGYGNDIIHVGLSNHNLEVAGDSRSGYGYGHDTIYCAGSADLVYGDSSSGGGEGNDTIYAGTYDDDLISGGGGDDTIFGSDAIQLLFGDDGNDTIYAGAHRVNIEGGNGDDVIYTGTAGAVVYGDDYVGTTSGHDTFFTYQDTYWSIEDLETGEIVTDLAENDPPLIRVPVDQQTEQDESLAFGSQTGNLVFIYDVDMDGSENLQVQLNVTDGTLSLADGFAGITFSEGDGTADTTMTFTGTMEAINAAMNAMVFTPDTGFTGTATLRVVTADLDGTAGSRTQSVNIDVVSV